MSEKSSFPLSIASLLFATEQNTKMMGPKCLTINQDETVLIKEKLSAIMYFKQDCLHRFIYSSVYLILSRESIGNWFSTRFASSVQTVKIPDMEAFLFLLLHFVSFRVYMIS